MGRKLAEQSGWDAFSIGTYMSESSKAGIVRNYITKFPNTPNLTLAKKIYAENSKTFKDVEDARSMIRKKKGQSGETERKRVKDKSQFAKAGKLNPFKLPESYGVPRLPFKLPLSCNNILCISDLHCPYHDIAALTAALQYGVDNEINCVLINGDLIDFFMLSRFEKTPHKRSVAEEFDTTRAVLKVIRDTFPNALIYYLKGNHCERYEKWLYVKAPEIFDVPEFQLSVLLRLNEFKITMLEDVIVVKAGKLNISHGHHVIKGVFSPVNSARGAYTKVKSSILIGHCHQVSNHTEKDLEGNLASCWSQGALCLLQPDYDPLNTKHSHGFAHIRTQPNGDYTVMNKMIYKGRIL